MTQVADPPPQGIADAMMATARRDPDLLAVVTEEAMFTFAQFAEVTRRFAHRMRALGVARGSVVAVESHDPLIVLPSVLAAALLGAAWIPYGNHVALRGVVSPTHWIRSKGTDPREKQDFALADESWFRPPEVDPGDLPAVDAKAPFLFVNTSGTTGTPKRLALSQAKMLARSVAVRGEFVERETVFASLFPVTAFPFITRVLACLVNGCTVVCSRDPEVWRAAGVNHVYGSAKQVAEHLGAAPLPYRFAQIQVSGAKADDALYRHLLASFDVVADLYASTETNRSFKNIKYLGKDGQVRTKGCKLTSEVEILDVDGAPLGPGQVGVVRVRNPYLEVDYIDNPEARAEAFRDGWFYPGDMGSWGAEGELRIHGRKGDVINAGGVKINAMQVDEVLRGCAGIADAMCFEDPLAERITEVIGFVTFAPGADPRAAAEAALAECARQLGPARTPRRLVQIDRIPRADDGGAQRFKCRDLYLQMKQQQASSAG